MLGLHRAHPVKVEVQRSTPARYTYSRATVGGWRIVEAGALVVEVVSRESVAASLTAHLNAGEARIDRHALIGCRVVPTQEGQG